MKLACVKMCLTSCHDLKNLHWESMFSRQTRTWKTSSTDFTRLRRRWRVSQNCLSTGKFCRETGCTWMAFSLRTKSVSSFQLKLSSFRTSTESLKRRSSRLHSSHRCIKCLQERTFWPNWENWTQMLIWLDLASPNSSNRNETFSQDSTSFLTKNWLMCLADQTT